MRPESSSVPTPRITGVSGGVAGVEAERAAAYFLARVYDSAGDRARDWAALGPRTMTDGDLLESAPVSPDTFAAAQAAVLLASVGPHGALAQSVVWETEALLVRSAVDLVVAADDLARQVIEARDYALGRLLIPLALAGGAAAVALGGPALGVAVGVELASPAGRARHLDRLQEVMSEHPDLVETGFNAGGGVLDGLLGTAPWPGAPWGLRGFHPDTGSAAAEVAGWYDDGAPRVRELDGSALPDRLTAARSQPASLADLVGSLAGVAGLSVGASSPLNGTVAVSTLGPDGGGDRSGQGRRHIVYIPGTDDMTTTPWSQDGDVRDLATNLDLMAGTPTSYAAGVLQAMADAGVRPGEPVLLVGHSQGGMVAAALAAADTPYDVRHVVTAGSPTAQVDLPADVRVLSLENRGDVVPLTDGEPNRPSVGQVTVQFDAGGEGLAGHHDHPRYVAGAAAADASDSASITAELDALRAAGFLGDGSGVLVETRVYAVTRE